jgi:hypothetical protein
MHRIIFAASVLLQFTCLPIELSAQSQTGAAKPGTATVSGRVTAKGILFRNATVILQPEQPAVSQDQNSILRAQTDENGSYKITGVSARRYRIVASASRFFIPPGRVVRPGGTVLNIGEGENIENMDLELKRGGVITGRVTYSNTDFVVNFR